MRKHLIIAGALAAMSTTASAQFYISGSYGIVDQDDSNNDGSFTSDFTTGAVTGVTPPLTIPAGSDVGWKTEFDTGEDFSIAVGWRMENYRLELSYTRNSSDIDKHEGVSAAGIDLTAIDAGVLISGNVGDLGVSVGDLVADGKGEIDNDILFLNGYYDFNNDTAFTPFVGVGIGYSQVDVNYKPSNVSVIDDDDSTFIYQLVAGASYSLTDTFDLTASVHYRDGDEASVNSSLLPAKFDIENESIVYKFGIRYNF